jgi:hypothetical protein
MPIDSIVITYRDYLLIGVIGISLIAAVVSACVVAYQILSDRSVTKKEDARVIVKS